MSLMQRAMGFWRSRRRSRHALALAGGGVLGGMYEVGAVSALEEGLNGAGRFDVYVGCSAGAVVASLLANGVPASEIFRVIDQDIDDPLNFRRNAVYASDAFRHAAGRFGRLLWAVGKNAVKGLRGSVPDMLAHAERDLPAGFFDLRALERFMREAFERRGLTNSFGALEPTLFIPAVDIDRAQRVVFGHGELRQVPISHAVAASSAIPGFFEPYAIDGRDYVDGGVGWSGHADLAAEAGARVVVVVSPLVPDYEGGIVPLRNRGLYSIMEQASRIYSQNLLQLGLTSLRVKYPRTEFFLIQPSQAGAPMFGPSMGFAASRAALRLGYESTKTWLADQGTPLLRRLRTALQPVAI
ncbi:MAG: patatin-like phospholipase family protein [candidate division NC10 bacterium]